MKEFKIKPDIKMMEKAEEFCREFCVGKNDLLFVSSRMYDNFFKGLTKGATIVNYRKYGLGEPTDLMVEGIYNDIKDIDYNRVIAVGGGTILDVES